jgi:hypothetical protein
VSRDLLPTVHAGTVARLAAIQERHDIHFNVGLDAIKEISPKFKPILEGVLFVNIISWFKPDEFGCELGMEIVESFYYQCQPFENCCEPSDDGTLLVRVESNDEIPLLTRFRP